MEDDLQPFTRLLADARGGSSPALGELLTSLREYMSAVAVSEVPRNLQARIPLSSLVQETFVRACRDFNRFRGGSRDQLRNWLRSILMHRMMSTLRKREFRLGVSGSPTAKPACWRMQLMTSQRFQSAMKL
ncbi:MAG: sigma factor [Gemmataceae bacterium]